MTGISTRGAQALYRACQAFAAINGREYVLPEDIQYLAPFVLGHRLSAGEGGAASAREQLDRILERIPVPLETV